MSEQKEHFYEFGPFRLDAAKRRLFRQGEPVQLTPKAFDTLMVLIEHSGQVMEKEELMKRLWPSSFVEEANLSVNISVLRKVLGESPHEHRYIVTIPGRGYSFVADVKERWDEDAELIIHERTRSEVVIDEESDIRPETALDTSRAGYLAATPKQYHKGMMLALAALVVAGVAFLAYKLISWKGAAAPFERAKLNRLTTTGTATRAAVSPDGKFIAFAVTDEGQQSLWIRQIATTSNVQIIAPASVVYLGLTFSGDGNYVYYVRSEGDSPGMLYRVPVLGGSSIKLAADVDTPVTLSPDDKQLAFVRGYPDQGEAALMLANADGSREQKLSIFKGNPNFFIVGKSPAWSPDGTSIVCSAKNIDDRGEYHHLFEVQVEGGAIKPLGSGRWQQIGRAAWLAQGRGLVITAADEASLLSQQIWYVSYPAGEARKITNDLNDYRDVSVTGDSKTLITVQSDQQANIWITTGTDASRATQITSGNYDGANGLAWTPGGKIIYTARTGDNQNLWVVDQDGNNQRQLTANAGNNRSPTVSPDGRHVVFVSDRTGTRYLWKMNLDGGQPVQLTTGSDDDNPDFSPDGQWIVYKSYLYGNPNLLRVALEGGEPLRLTDKISVKPAVSPLPGGLIACFYRDPALSPNKLVLIPFNGGQPVKTLDVPMSLGPLRWSTDGQSLTYIKTLGGVSNIWSQPIDGGAPVQLTNFQSDRIFWFDWSRDGKSLAYARGVVHHDVVMISDLQ